MISSIIVGITRTLYDEFGNDYKYIIDQIEQGFEDKNIFGEPCFFIRLIRAENNQFLNNRYKLNQSFEIRLHNEKSKNKNDEFHKIGNKVMDLLEYIKDGDGLIRGTRRNFIINDGVLQVFVDYDFYAYREVEPDPYMLILDGRYKTRR